jgi:hypothetical protein
MCTVAKENLTSVQEILLSWLVLLMHIAYMHSTPLSSIDNLHVRLIFDLGKKVNSRKELIKISKNAKFGYEML